MVSLEKKIKPGMVLDKKYKILSHISQGAQAFIYKAEEIDTKRVVALKLVHDGLNGIYADNAKRLEHEYNALSRLDGLQGFLKPYKCKIGKKVCYISMEWLDESKDGAAYISDKGPLDLET